MHGSLHMSRPWKTDLDGRRGIDFEEVHARDGEAPVLAHLAHLVRHQLLDFLTRGQSVVQTHVTDDAAQRGLHKTLHSLDNIEGLGMEGKECGYLVGNTDGIGDLNEHHGMDRDFHIISRDNRLQREVKDGLAQIHNIGVLLVVLHFAGRARLLSNQNRKGIQT